MSIQKFNQNLRLVKKIISHQLQAVYWVALAVTGLAKHKDVRDVYYGYYTPLTGREKIQDAMTIAINHMHMVKEIVGKLSAGK